MEHTVRFGNIHDNSSREMIKPHLDNEGKLQDYSERCDSGIDSYYSFDCDSRLNSCQSQPDQSVSMSLQSLSLSESKFQEESGDKIDDWDDGYRSASLTEPPNTVLPDSSSTSTTGSLVDISGYYRPDEEGDTYLQLAIIQKNTDLAFNLVQNCTQPEFLNIANANQQTALHLAVLTDQPHVTRCLVAYGADVRRKDRQGNTPLHVACELGLVGQIDMLTLKLEENEDPGFQTLPLPQCVNEYNYSGCTPLHLAVTNNQVEAVKVLATELKCDVNARDLKSGKTALHHSIEAANYSLSKLLLQAGANVDALTYDECAPLHYAAARGFKKETELLLHNNADLYLITLEDFDVFELSLHSKSRRVIALLKKEDERRQKRRQHRGIN